MSKKTRIIFIIIIILIILFFLISITYKKIQSGKTIHKSTFDYIDYILNIHSFEAKTMVTIQSNKTTNQYFIEQYYKEPNYFKQVIIEPSNIANLETIYNGNSLILKNTNLGLTKIYENYPYLNENVLWLKAFIQKDKTKWTKIENGEEIILSSNENMYHYQKTIYINSRTMLPSKMEIIDNSNQAKVYIEYKEIKI